MSPSALWLQRWALGSPRVHRGLFSAYGTASVPTRRWAGWHCGSLPLWSSSGSAQFLLKYSGKCCSSFTNSVLFPDWCLFLLCTHKQYLGNLVAQCLEVILLEVCQRNEWPYPNGLSEKMRTSFGWRLSSVSGTAQAGYVLSYFIPKCQTEAVSATSFFNSCHSLLYLGP